MSTIKRVKHTRDYTVMSNECLRNPAITAKAKGIWCYLMSLPDDWEIYVKELTRHFADGRDSITAGIDELIGFGYVSRTRKRNERGQLGGYNYFIYETVADNPYFGCEQLDAAEYGKPEIGKSENGLADFGKSDTNKVPIKPSTDKASTYLTIPPSPEIPESEVFECEVITPYNTKAATTNISPAALALAPLGEPPCDFTASAFWQMWHELIGATPAEYIPRPIVAAFVSMTNAQKQAIQAHAPKYIASTQPRYVVSPTKCVRGERCDEPIIDRTGLAVNSVRDAATLQTEMRKSEQSKRLRKNGFTFDKY